MVESYPVFGKNIVPDYLIAEVIKGKPYYYKGYKNVLNKEQTLEDIMGASGLQGLVVGYLMRLLAALDDDAYHILPNETGIHFDTNNNLSGDILIFDASKPIIFDTHYVSRAPDINIEVDVNVDIADADEQEYVFDKIQTLLDFGTEKVIWIFTKSDTVLVATPNADWQWISTTKDIEILRGITFNIADFLKRKSHLIRK